MVKSLDGYTPFPFTVTDEVAAVPVQLASSGPKRAKLIEPVGLSPPARVAVSLTGTPASTVPAETAVVRVGVIRPPVTRTDSAGSRQAVGPSPKLLASPS